MTVKITVCKYRAPRKSERTWQAAAKYSIRNRGHQRAGLSTAVVAQFQEPRMALSTMYQHVQ